MNGNFAHLGNLNLGNPLLDLFASRPCQELRQYIAWRPDCESLAKDAFQQDFSIVV